MLCTTSAPLRLPEIMHMMHTMQAVTKQVAAAGPSRERLTDCCEIIMGVCQPHWHLTTSHAVTGRRLQIAMNMRPSTLLCLRACMQSSCQHPALLAKGFAVT
jgi:hypothetical protein